jgi:hypothetical protein
MERGKDNQMTSQKTSTPQSLSNLEDHVLMMMRASKKSQIGAIPSSVLQAQSGAVENGHLT